MVYVSELLENKIDLLIEKVQEELADISYQLKVANDLKKVEIAHKLKFDTENDTDIEIIKGMMLIDKLVGYKNLDTDPATPSFIKQLKDYEEYLDLRYV